MSVSAKGVDDGGGHLGDGGGLVEETLFLGVGDEAHLKEDRGTCRFEKYPEGGLSHAAVLSIEVSDETFLHLLDKTQGLIHVAVLHLLEHDI